MTADSDKDPLHAALDREEDGDKLLQGVRLRSARVVRLKTSTIFRWTSFQTPIIVHLG